MVTKDKENTVSQKEPAEIKSIETLDLGLGGSGMVCDFQTGVCGPINEEKEDKK